MFLERTFEIFRSCPPALANHALGRDRMADFRALRPSGRFRKSESRRKDGTSLERAEKYRQ